MFFQIFSGDALACQIEAGNQKGGRYFCWFCNHDGNRGNDLAYSLNVEHRSLKQNIKLVLQTVNGRKGATGHKTNYFEDLPKAEVIAELHERKVNNLLVLTKVVLNCIFISPYHFKRAKR